MACCALAAFLIGQIIFGLDWARERLGLGAPPAPTPNAAVGWRLGQPAVPSPAAHRQLDRRFSRRVALAALGAGAAFAVLSGATLALRAAARPLDLGPVCTTLGLQHAASRSVR